MSPGAAVEGGLLDFSSLVFGTGIDMDCLRVWGKQQHQHNNSFSKLSCLESSGNVPILHHPHLGKTHRTRETAFPVKSDVAKVKTSLFHEHSVF